MNQRRVGDAVRLVRRERRLRQIDVALAAGVSQSCVSDLECGRLDELRLPTVRAIAGALDMSISIDVRWRGSELAQLLDRDHAALVETVVRVLRSQGWAVAVEWSFNHFGERGSVDLLGWNARRRALLILEAKTRVLDVQEVLATFGRKIRLVPRLLAAEREWRPALIGRVLVIQDSTAARSAIQRHKATFDAGYPGRGVDVRRWLRDPSSDLSAIWFLSHRPRRCYSGFYARKTRPKAELLLSLRCRRDVSRRARGHSKP